MVGTEAGSRSRAASDDEGQVDRDLQDPIHFSKKGGSGMEKMFLSCYIFKQTDPF